LFLGVDGLCPAYQSFYIPIGNVKNGNQPLRFPGAVSYQPGGMAQIDVA
jgi:hypothetical protein